MTTLIGFEVVVPEKKTRKLAWNPGVEQLGDYADNLNLTRDNKCPNGHQSPTGNAECTRCKVLGLGDHVMTEDGKRRREEGSGCTSAKTSAAEWDLIMQSPEMKAAYPHLRQMASRLLSLEIEERGDGDGISSSDINHTIYGYAVRNFHNGRVDVAGIANDLAHEIQGFSRGGGRYGTWTRESFKLAERTPVASWRSTSGKFGVDLYRSDDGSYGYSSIDGSAGGTIGNVSEADAIAKIQGLVDGGGYFQPDSHVNTMQRISAERCPAKVKGNGSKGETQHDYEKPGPKSPMNDIYMATRHTAEVPSNVGSRDMDPKVLRDQIGMGNVLSISGGRWSPITGRSGKPVGIELPVSSGYKVRVYLADDDTYTVQRVFRENVKGEQTGVYADQVGEAAYRAGMYRSGNF
jgi:hypothetical protein